MSGENILLEALRYRYAHFTILKVSIPVELSGENEDGDKDDDEKSSGKKSKKRSGGINSRHSMFEPHLKNFFVRSVDPSHIKILKLEIMTNLATEANVAVILREFQSYITGQDKVCVAATIQVNLFLETKDALWDILWTKYPN